MNVISFIIGFILGLIFIRLILWKLKLVIISRDEDIVGNKMGFYESLQNIRGKKE